MEIKNYHVFTVVYKGATNTQGSRVIITSERFKQKITISFDYALNNITDMAGVELVKRGYDIHGMGEIKGGYVLFSSTFNPLK